METINDRIEVIVNELFDCNKAAFAKAIGLAPTAISSYLGKQRRSRPSVDMVINIVKVTGVSYSWLLPGRGFYMQLRSIFKSNARHNLPRMSIDTL